MKAFDPTGLHAVSNGSFLYQGLVFDFVRYTGNTLRISVRGIPDEDAPAWVYEYYWESIGRREE